MILWDKVPINLFIDETFLKDPFKYITEEGFKLKDQKIVISKILKHDEAHPVGLEERVQRLEEWMGRFNIHLERLMQNENDNGHFP